MSHIVCYTFSYLAINNKHSFFNTENIKPTKSIPKNKKSRHYRKSTHTQWKFQHNGKP